MNVHHNRANGCNNQKNNQMTFNAMNYCPLFTAHIKQNLLQYVRQELYLISFLVLMSNYMKQVIWTT